jgi:hypothetical protein
MEISVTRVKYSTEILFLLYLSQLFTCCLDPFVKLRTETISDVMSVCPSGRIGQLGPQWTDFHEI